MTATENTSSNAAVVAATLAVDRASHDFRRGRAVHICDDAGKAIIAVASEMCTDQVISRLAELGSDEPAIAITHHRARTLKVRLYTNEIVLIPSKSWRTAEIARTIADPTTDLANPLRGPYTANREPVDAASIASVQLAKIARLLPSVILVPSDGSNDHIVAEDGISSIRASDVMSYEMDTAGSLRQVTAARVPLEDAENTRILTFRSPDGGREHLAIVIGEPPTDRPVLARIHSECFTGDLVGSLKCDCGQQLRGAIAQIGKEGAGILLYLRQEGRGIGLTNKLRAYALQDQGFDTVEANERLGFESDERIFLPAARILKQLGFTQVRLMTNNPDKVEGLTSFGIEVLERVPHAFPSNDHNEFYLSVKKEKSGHLL
ncbi:MAG: GTP cyclohydrolase II [Alphaproteobacteria bacterium]|nr:GTP cyclohydrolase II [Alphaproteobacteria bacterium]